MAYFKTHPFVSSHSRAVDSNGDEVLVPHGRIGDVIELSVEFEFTRGSPVIRWDRLQRNGAEGEMEWVQFGSGGTSTSITLDYVDTFRNRPIRARIVNAGDTIAHSESIVLTSEHPDATYFTLGDKNGTIGDHDYLNGIGDGSGAGEGNRATFSGDTRDGDSPFVGLIRHPDLYTNIPDQPPLVEADTEILAPRYVEVGDIFQGLTHGKLMTVVSVINDGFVGSLNDRNVSTFGIFGNFGAPDEEAKFREDFGAGAKFIKLIPAEFNRPAKNPIQ